MPGEAAAFRAEDLVAGGREGSRFFYGLFCAFVTCTFPRISAVFACVLAGHFLGGVAGRERERSIHVPPH